MPQRFLRGDRCSVFYSGDIVRPCPRIKPKTNPPEIDTKQWRNPFEDALKIEVLASERVSNQWYGPHDRLKLEITMPCLKKNVLTKEERYAVQVSAIGAGFLPLSMRHLRRDLLPPDHFELKVWRCYQPSFDYCHILEVNLNGTINYWSALKQQWFFESRSIFAYDYYLLPNRYSDRVPEDVKKILT